MPNGETFFSQALGVTPKEGGAPCPRSCNYVTNKNSPFFGQAGIEPGTTDPVSGVNCPASSQAPCSDNVDYRKATSRVGARQLRAALKISF